MPWDASTLKVQTGMGVVTVAGGVDQPDEGVCQPQWAPDGSLWFSSDREDWWSLYRWTPEDGVEQMLHLPGEVGAPKWAVRRTRGTPSSATAGSSSRSCTRATTRCTCSSVMEPCSTCPSAAPASTDLVAGGDTVVLIGSSPVEEPAVLRFVVGQSEGEVLSTVQTLSVQRDLGIDPAGSRSRSTSSSRAGTGGRRTRTSTDRPTRAPAAGRVSFRP